MLNETKNSQFTSSRVKRSIQSGHRLTPYEQRLHIENQQRQRHYERLRQEHHLRQQQHQKQQQHQQQQQQQQYYRNQQQQSNRDARRYQTSHYQQMQLSPPHDHQRYLYQHDNNPSYGHQRLSETKDFTIEVLVAVDKKMREYHGRNLENYVLTLMSVVSCK
jgi:uncharacterized membrane-anchored protein